MKRMMVAVNQFLDAWATSGNHLVSTTSRTENDCRDVALLSLYKVFRQGIINGDV